MRFFIYIYKGTYIYKGIYMLGNSLSYKLKLINSTLVFLMGGFWIENAIYLFSLNRLDTALSPKSSKLGV